VNAHPLKREPSARFPRKRLLPLDTAEFKFVSPFTVVAQQRPPECPALQLFFRQNAAKIKINDQYEIELYKYSMHHLITWGTTTPVT
jgi:hypothetical protein